MFNQIHGIMKIYRILLWDRVTNSIEKVEELKGEESDLKQRLYDLQLGYCEGERPTVHEITTTPKASSDSKIRCIIAESDCDFCYMSPVAKV